MPGDVNGDSQVTFGDLLILAQNYGRSPATYAQGDLNNDGTVSFADLLMLAQNYGKTTGPTAAAATPLASASSVSSLLKSRTRAAARLVR
jgi:hypothetical protein